MTCTHKQESVAVRRDADKMYAIPALIADSSTLRVCLMLRADDPFFTILFSPHSVAT